MSQGHSMYLCNHDAPVQGGRGEGRRRRVIAQTPSTLKFQLMLKFE